MRIAALLILAAACATSTEPSDTDGVGTDSGETDTEAAPEVHVIDAATLKGWLDEGKELALINVHVPRNGEITGTDVHITFRDVDGIEAWLDDPDRLVVLYCRTGPMSAQASAALVDRGHTQVYDLTVGMVGWLNAGYTLDD